MVANASNNAESFPLDLDHGEAVGEAMLSLGKCGKIVRVTGAVTPVPDSAAIRTLRAGRGVTCLVPKSVAIVGLGADGSFTADLLTRHGIGCQHLVEGDHLRPGNAVRHLVTNRSLELLPKVDAVASHLQGPGYVVGTKITMHASHVTSVAEARDLLNHDLVIDATAAGITSTLLIEVAETMQRPLVSVATQRSGGITRTDRWPLEPDENPLEPLPERDETIDGSPSGEV